jgi:DNA-binding GntR family transcriptional regulator
MTKTKEGIGEKEVYEILSRVLLSGCLAVGTKLGENHLAGLFGVSRERIRKVLHRLGHERKIDLVPRRGAFTIDPGLEDARMVYEARRVLEGGLIMHAAERLMPEDIDALETHLAAEEEAIRSEDWALAIKLAGDFHRKLVTMSGNTLIGSYLDELIARTSVMLTFFGPGAGSPCSCREHRAILDAVRMRDPVKAYYAMASHLSLVETRLQPQPRASILDIDTAVRAVRDEWLGRGGAVSPGPGKRHVSP